MHPRGRIPLPRESQQHPPFTQGAMHCTLNKQYRSLDRKNQPNPRPRRRIMHPRCGLSFPRIIPEHLTPAESTHLHTLGPSQPSPEPHQNTYPSPKAHSVRSRQAIPGSRTGRACPTRAQGAILCTLGAGYPSQESANSTYPSPRAQYTAPSARNTTTADRQNLPNPHPRRNPVRPRGVISWHGEGKPAQNTPRVQSYAPSRRGTLPKKAARVSNSRRGCKAVHPPDRLPLPEPSQST